MNRRRQPADVMIQTQRPNRDDPTRDRAFELRVADVKEVEMAGRLADASQAVLGHAQVQA